MMYLGINNVKQTILLGLFSNESVFFIFVVILLFFIVYLCLCLCEQVSQCSGCVLDLLPHRTLS